MDRIGVGASEITFTARGSRSAPATLLLHGGGFDRRVWEHCATELAERCRVVSLDLPGHGESRGRAIRSVAEGSEIVDVVRDALGIERWIVLGHSMGGAVAQDYTRRFPDRVVALGLISTAPWFGLDPEVVDEWREQGASYSRERLDAIVAPCASEPMRAHVLSLRDRMTPDAVQGDLDTCASWDGRAQAAQLELPVLLMTTAFDLPVIREAIDAWEKSLPDAVRVDIEDAGHMMMVEQPEATSAAIAAWVEGVLARTEET